MWSIFWLSLMFSVSEHHRVDGAEPGLVFCKLSVIQECPGVCPQQCCLAHLLCICGQTLGPLWFSLSPPSERDLDPVRSHEEPWKALQHARDRGADVKADGCFVGCP